MSEEDDLLEVDEHQPLASPIGQIVDRIMAGESHWAPATRLDFGDLAWQPHLVATDQSAVLHVHAADRLRPYLVARMLAAAAAGFSVHVALPLGAMFDESVLDALGEVDAIVHVLGEGEDQAPTINHLLGALADEGVPVGAKSRTKIAKFAWSRRAEGTVQQRGRRFEALVSFLLSQIADFRVRERNFRGVTDEIDIVVQVDRVSSRCWYESGVPFILVEAKNWTRPVDQKEVSAFITKMQTKRGRSRIGLMVGASDFTSDAKLQELKHATQEIVVVFIGPAEMEGWIVDEQPDEFLEELVRHAMLR
jgi:hypothetical protein